MRALKYKQDMFASSCLISLLQVTKATRHDQKFLSSFFLARVNSEKQRKQVFYEYFSVRWISSCCCYTSIIHTMGFCKMSAFIDISQTNNQYPGTSDSQNVQILPFLLLLPSRCKCYSYTMLKLIINDLFPSMSKSKFLPSFAIA